VLGNNQSPYRWYILALGVATDIFALGMSRMCMPVLFEEISEDLGLNLVEVGTIWGLSGLAGLFTAFAWGLFGDRYGTRLTLGLACILQGIAAALRGISGGFTSLAIYMFAFGFFSVPLAFTTHKAAGEWFSVRQLGLANSVIAMGMGVGTTLGSMISATVLSPLLGGWRNTMFVYGAIAIVVGFLWLQARRSPSLDAAALSTKKIAFRQGLSHLIRLKPVWLFALSQMLLIACHNGFIGYLPLHLLKSGWTTVNADGALAAFCAASAVGVIPLAWLSDRIGLRKVIIYPILVITIIGVGLLSVFGGAVVWPIVIVTGFVREGLAAIMITMVMEIEGVGAAYAATALGLSGTFMAAGSFFSPPVGNRLALINPGFAFIFWSALAAIGTVIFSPIKETGWRAKSIQTAN
jgi:MFS family permease